MSLVAEGTAPAATRPGAGKRRRRIWLAAALAVLLPGALASLFAGSRPMPPAAVLEALLSYDAQNDLHLIIWSLRLPRMCVALLTGLALGTAGALMQALTRNPLAEPGLLGINAGAALAVMTGISLFGFVSIWEYVWFGFAGAGLAGIAVFALGQAHETGTNPVRLVLAGAGLSVMLGSASSLIIINSPPEVLDGFRNWAAGSFEGRSFSVATVLALATFCGLLIAQILAPGLNALALGRDTGEALGVNTRVLFTASCLAIMLLTGAATAAAGPIGFIGLVAPHIARSITGPDFRWVLPFSGLIAAILLLAADVAGRLIAMPAEVAAGIIASLAGGPFFIAIVRRFRLRHV